MNHRHTAPVHPETPTLSLVIPCHNEEFNLRILVSTICEAVDPLQLPYEIIITDDCSTDNSWALLKELAAGDQRVRAQRFASNCGQSAALWSGLQAARGIYLVTLDADLQNDPKDLPKMLEALNNYDCVCGTRVQARKKGDPFLRLISSRIANWVRNGLSGEQLSDSGCCYRIFRRECIENLKFFDGMHRFLPTLFRYEGFAIVEIPVRHHPRFMGRSHYSIWHRLFTAGCDLLAVCWMKKRMIHFQIAETIIPAPANGTPGVAGDFRQQYHQARPPSRLDYEIPAVFAARS